MDERQQIPVIRAAGDPLTRTLRQWSAGLAVLAFVASLVVLIVQQPGTESRLLTAGVLFGLTLLGFSVWLGTLDKG